MLLSLAWIFLLGLALGGLMQKLGLPSLLGMLLTGILLAQLGAIDASLLDISSSLREIALVIILLRAGKIVDAAPVGELVERYAPGKGLEDVYLAVFGEDDGR